MVALTNSAEFSNCITMLVYREAGLTEALSFGNRSTYSSSMATSWLRLLCFVTVWRGVELPTCRCHLPAAMFLICVPHACALNSDWFQTRCDACLCQGYPCLILINLCLFSSHNSTSTTNQQYKDINLVSITHLCPTSCCASRFLCNVTNTVSCCKSLVWNDTRVILARGHTPFQPTTVVVNDLFVLVFHRYSLAFVNRCIINYLTKFVECRNPLTVSPEFYGYNIDVAYF